MNFHNINFIETEPTHWATDKSFSVNAEKAVITLNARNQNLSSFLITEALQHLTKLDLSKNRLTELVFDLDMPDLEFLDLSYNQVPLEKVVFKGRFPKLKYLYVYQSQLKSIVFENAMPSLEILNLAENGLEVFDLPKGFEELVSLRLDNNQLPNFHIDPNDLEALEYLRLQKNPFTKNEIIQGLANDSENCLDTITDYFIKGKIHGFGFDNECKILLIGEGNVGKSCFVERLINNKFKKEWDSTHAIAIKKYLLNDYQLNLWDFGGQDIYHSTHRLFMSSNAVYLLFWDKVTEASEHTPCLVEDNEERKYKVHKLPYWLSYAKTLGKGSKSIVIQTKSGKHGESDIPNQSTVRQQFRDTIIKNNGFQHIESQDDDWDENGYNDLLPIIKRAVSKLKKNSELLNNGIKIREALRDAQEEKRKLMPFEEYVAIANKHGIANDNAISPMVLLKTWLVPTGVVYYREGLMDNQIILNQGWAIEAIYSLFDRKQHYHRLSKKKGTVTGKDLVQIWSPNFDEHEQKLFIDFMLSCELCFETTPEPKAEDRYKTIELSERIFIVPQLLSYKRPDEQIEDFLEDRESWYVRYQHDFWHYGIMQSFIVRAKDLADERAIWQIGILLKDGKSRALVETKDKTVIVRVSRNGKALLDKIRNELNEINQDNQDTIQESVSLDGKSYVSVKKLKDCDRANKSIPAENGVQVPLNDLLVFLDTDEKARFKVEKEKDTDRGFHFDEKISDFEPPKPIEKPAIPKEKIKKETKNEEKRKILFLAAVPKNMARISPDEEFVEIEKQIKSSEYRDKFDLKSEFAVKSDKIILALDDNPEIVHFAGHGGENGIYITDRNGDAQLLDDTALIYLFEDCSNLKTVLLNSCYSEKQAKVISKLKDIETIGYTIESDDDIPDELAIEFSSGFYLGLGANKDTKGACKFGRKKVTIKYSGIEIKISIWKNGKKTEL